MAQNDGHEPRCSLPEREILPAGDAAQEVGRFVGISSNMVGLAIRA